MEGSYQFTDTHSYLQRKLCTKNVKPSLLVRERQHVTENVNITIAFLLFFIQMLSAAIS